MTMGKYTWPVQGNSSRETREPKMNPAVIFTPAEAEYLFIKLRAVFFAREGN